MVDSLLEITADRNSKVQQAYRCPFCDKCYRKDWGKHDFSCGHTFCG